MGEGGGRQGERAAGQERVGNTWRAIRGYIVSRACEARSHGYPLNGVGDKRRKLEISVEPSEGPKGIRHAGWGFSRRRNWAQGDGKTYERKKGVEGGRELRTGSNQDRLEEIAEIGREYIQGKRKGIHEKNASR